MSRDIRIITWNMGGIPFLKLSEPERVAKREESHRLLESITKKYRPDIMLLQEVVRYDKQGVRENAQDRLIPPGDYHYQAHIAIDTARQNHPAKWRPVREAGNWPSKAYLGQGNGFMWHKDMAHCSIWDYRRKRANTSSRLEAEEVRVDTGIFTGNRDTEPRLAVVAHFIHRPSGRDIFVVNLHLTTLKGEREGFPERDERGAAIRRKQIGIVLNGIVSRYNEWREDQGATQLKERPVWILAGDFNAAPKSKEIKKLQQMNFLDLCKNRREKGSKRRRKGRQASITVDYIFAGPCYFAFDPYELQKSLENMDAESEENRNGPIYMPGVEKVSDHYPVFARFPLT